MTAPTETPTAASMPRVMVLWVPDWPVHAHLIEHGMRPADAAVRPIALVSRHRVIACSAAARAEGVRPGIREREAQARCPELELCAHLPELDERRFSPVLAALEQLIPGVDPIRPGLVAMRARGPARYYGDEWQAAQAILRLAAEFELPDVRVGIADGRFAAEQAARATPADPGVEVSAGIRLVRSEATPAFLAPLPVSRAAGTEFGEALRGLGIHTLGALVALPEAAVRERFGTEGVTAFRRASGAGRSGEPEVRPRDPERELAVELALEPPLDAAEQLAFACAALSERLVSGLAREGLVCTALRVELVDDIDVHHERVWSHPQRFTAFDVVNRVRWQAASMPRDPERTGSGIALVRLVPAHIDRAAAHEPGLWSDEPDERVHHHLSRIQGLLGPAGVGTARLAGGRLLSERQRFVPWNTEAPQASPSGPWPGALPGPHPTEVFPDPVPAILVDPRGEPVGIDADALLTASPARLEVQEHRIRAPVEGWSTPWEIRARWWRGSPLRHRLQIQLADGDAWILIRQSGRWFAEARYD